MKRLILVDTSALAKTPALGWRMHDKVLSILMTNPETGETYEYETTNLFNLFKVFEKIPNLNLDYDKIVFCCDRKTIRKEVPYELIEYLLNRFLGTGKKFSVRTLANENIQELINEAINAGFIELNEEGTMLNNYKDGRKANTDSYKIQMRDAEHDLAECGFTVLSKDGYEADDIIKYISHKYKEEYDEILVYCNDADLANILDPNDVINLCKISKYSHDACATTFEEQFGIPYNTMVLYKATVGDKSDIIKGVKGFGPKAFPKLLDFCKDEGYDLSKIRELDQEEEILAKYFCSDLEKLAQALFSLFLARPITDGLDLEINSNLASKDKTVEMLDKYKMNSVKRVFK